jgi:6-phosphogluconolactonase
MTSGSTDQTPVRTSGPQLPFGARIEVRSTPNDAAQAAADWIATMISTLAATQPTVNVAFSGGKTPQTMLEALIRHPMPWDQIHVYQVDERCVADTDPRRNAHQLLATVAPVLEAVGLGNHLHLMPIDPADLTTSLTRARVQVGQLSSPRFDLVHLGLGDDGHTASLIPGDDVLQVSDADVALTGLYQDTRRLTLTYPVLLQAHSICFLATGASKAPMVARLIAGDQSIPAGQLHHRPGALFVDSSAMGSGT